MTYQITLLEQEINGPLDGNMRLGLVHSGEQKAELEYRWDGTQFMAVFHGIANELPVPAHPVALLEKSITTMYALMTDAHRLPTDVFQDHQVSIDISK